jgi:hypothetical protein
MTHKGHTHRCSDCGQEYECHGDLERNFDGHPEVICRAFHVHRMTLCEACAEADL